MSSSLRLSAVQPSSSRKRQFHEITRSESRSPTPNPVPSKRRRTQVSSTPRPPTRRSSRSESVQASGRFVGDGFDYRRPTMAARVDDANTIDLTLSDDDDDGLPQSLQAAASPRLRPRREPTSSAPTRQVSVPMSVQEEPNPWAEFYQDAGIPVIDLSDDDVPIDPEYPRLQEQFHVLHRPPRSPSPEVEFVAERAVLRPPPRDAQPPPQQRAPWILPPGRPAALIDVLRENTRNLTHNMFQLANYHLPFLAQVDPNAARRTREIVPDLEIIEGEDEFGDIHLNYQQAAFQVGQNHTPEPPRASPYKAPPKPRDGFVRTYEEETILLCPKCGQELATGGENDNDPVRQVWVVKTCGHVYCGACVQARSKPARQNKHNKKRGKQPESDGFTKCVVSNCDKPLTSKTVMIQVYL